jgi:hypothetical protein
MRIKISMRHLAWGVLGLVSQQVFSQVTQDNNNGGGGSFVGWNAGAAQTLEVRNDANQPIEWYTDAIRRMWLTPTMQNQNFGWWQNSNLDFSGHLMIGVPGSTDPPLTYLHINRSGTGGVSVGYRPWMRAGTFMSDETDGMYVGLWRQGVSANAVINWSDDRSELDALRFIFTSTPDSSNQTATSNRYRGLEIARMIPDAAGDQGYFGVGDFASAVAQPAERVDLLDGRLRIRQLPSDPQADNLNRFMVVDNAGVVHWRNLPTGTAGCEWTMNTTPFNNHISTAFSNPNANCPDYLNAVGIGVDLTVSGSPAGKLVLQTYDFPRGIDVLSGMHADITTGIKVYASNAEKEIRGIDVDAVNNSEAVIEDNYGAGIKATGLARYSHGVYAHTADAIVDGRAAEFHCWDDADMTHGVHTTVTRGVELSYGVKSLNEAMARINFGVYAEATGYMENSTTYYGVMGVAFPNELTVELPEGVTAYGVYGAAPWGANAEDANSWAGYFNGDVMVNGDGWILNDWNVVSDSQFKSNVEEISNASEMLLSMAPKHYTMVSQSHPHLRFSQELQYGLIAQELEEILPTLVSSSRVPAVYDTLGNMLHEAVAFKGVNYTGLIPILIAGYKEQQQRIEDQATEVQELQSQLADQQALSVVENDQMQDLLTRIDQMEQLLALCCQAPTDTEHRNIGVGDTGSTNPSDDRILRIQPNPFNERTTLYYTLERTGRMQLMANSSDGKQLRV